MLLLNEHKSASYAPRTYHNASQGVTLAVAVDFNTAGERLTHKASVKGIVQGLYSDDHVQTARKLYSALKNADCRTVNIAGNGIYTFKKYGVSQQDINAYLYSILSLVHQHWKIDKIVSGGQTGVDSAGLVCALALGIPCVGTYPKGFKMRFEDGRDVDMNPDWIRDWIYKQVCELKEVV